jgi:hypothetical protein
METHAEQIYNALLALLKETKTLDLLSAVSDAKEGKAFGAASSKTRGIFLKLAENLTREQARR